MCTKLNTVNVKHCFQQSESTIKPNRFASQNSLPAAIFFRFKGIGQDLILDGAVKLLPFLLRWGWEGDSDWAAAGWITAPDITL